MYVTTQCPQTEIIIKLSSKSPNSLLKLYIRSPVVLYVNVGKHFECEPVTPEFAERRLNILQSKSISVVQTSSLGSNQIPSCLSSSRLWFRTSSQQKEVVSGWAKINHGPIAVWKAFKENSNLKTKNRKSQTRKPTRSNQRKRWGNRHNKDIHVKWHHHYNMIEHTHPSIPSIHLLALIWDRVAEAAV